MMLKILGCFRKLIYVRWIFILSYKENKINCEILKYLKYDLKGKEIDVYELIVRAEKNI